MQINSLFLVKLCSVVCNGGVCAHNVEAELAKINRKKVRAMMVHFHSSIEYL